MALDRLDWVAISGFFLIVAGGLQFELDGALLSVIVAGFALSLSTWRLYAGQLWEALGWLAWVIAALVQLVSPTATPLSTLVFISALLAGVVLLGGGRYGVFPDIV